MKKNILLILCFALLLTSVASCANNPSLITDSASNPALIEDTTNTPKETTNVLGSDSNAEITSENSLNTENNNYTEISEPIETIDPIKKRSSAWSQLTKSVWNSKDLLNYLSSSNDYNISLNSLAVYPFLGTVYYVAGVKTWNLKNYRQNVNSTLINNNVRHVNLYEYQAEFPVEYMGKIDENYIYVIYRGLLNNRVMYFYSIYQYADEVLSSGTIRKGWYHEGERYYITKLYSIDDLKILKKGDIIDQEMMINLSLTERVVNVWEKYNDDYITGDYDASVRTDDRENVTYYSSIMLKEGVAVMVSFQKKYDSGIREFVSIEFYPYGTKCEKYPELHILSDGFIPTLPE